MALDSRQTTVKMKGSLRIKYEVNVRYEPFCFLLEEGDGTSPLLDTLLVGESQAEA